MGSLWKKTARMPGFPTLEGDARTDVLIIGGGLAGLLCAWKLEQAGVDYLLVEAERVAGGVTGDTTAKLTSQHGLIYHKLLAQFGAEKARLYYEANEGALAAYRALAGKMDCDFQEEDNYIYSRTGTQGLEQEMEALGLLNIPAELVTALPLPFPVAGAVRFPRQGRFHPLKFLAAIAEGLNIRERTRAISWKSGEVVTDRGTIRAEKVIVATHFPLFDSHGGYFLKLYQHRSYVIALKGAGPLAGMYLDETDTGLSFRSQEDLLLLGGGGHRTGKAGGGWQELEQFARIHYPKAEVVERWATQDCMSLDGAPYIGPYSRNTPGLYVAAGFNKWGMTTAMAAAEVLCDLTRGKESPYEELFSPSRTMLRVQLAANVMEAAMDFMMPVTPRCSHMGCVLRYNAQEHSWDCPCHGSRFSKQGKVLDNPATRDM